MIDSCSDPPPGPLLGHTEKIYSIEFHPLASGILASSSYDLTVRLWNLEAEEQVKLLTGHQDQVGDQDPDPPLSIKHHIKTVWPQCGHLEYLLE